MKKIEIIIFGILFIGGFGAMFLPNTEPFEHVINEAELLAAVNKEGRYITTDEIAQVIIESDPSFLLIDVRSAEAFEKYTLDGAINIPSDKIFEEENEMYFNQDVYTTVLFSNGSSLADQTWLRLRSYDYKGNKVMKGGLNNWYNTIINPQPPNDMDYTEKSYNQYLFRKGASVFFTGAQVVSDAPKDTEKQKKKKPVIKRKKKEVSGGCG